MSKVTIEMKKGLLNQTEVMSLKHEGVILIDTKKMKGWVCGEEIKLTNTDINYLYKKMLFDEGY
jgi:hypothetical protein